ncbi:MAG: hypothetical protein MZV70_46310, partial [Desulfobacterales bacterium]|nr:hypothetical protein [Desulfobacterales bacterium]
MPHHLMTPPPISSLLPIRLMWHGAHPLTSNTITVSGINTAADISITGGIYSINGESYTNSNGTVNNGNTVKVLESCVPVTKRLTLAMQQ